MKKLIVVVFILLASTCWADTKDDVFNYLEVMDISHMQEEVPGTSIGVTRLTFEEFETAIAEFFKYNTNYLLVKPLVKFNGSFCMAFTDFEKMYACCIDGRIVALKEIK